VLIPDYYRVRLLFWWHMAQAVPTQWTADTYLLGASARSARDAETALELAGDRADRTTVLFAEAASSWRRAIATERTLALYDTAAQRALKVIQADPYNPYGLRHLVRALGVSRHPGLAERAIERFEHVFGTGVLAGYHRGSMMIGYAWDGRGAGWAPEVTAEQWNMFGERLSRARADLEHVLRRNPRMWQASHSLIGVAMGMGLGDDYAEARFQEAIAACPTDYKAYARLEYYYTPKWGGSVAKMVNVGRRAAATGLYRAGIPFILFEAYVWTTEGLPPEDRPRVTRDLLLSPDVRSEIEDMLQGAERAGVDSPRARTIRLLYAYWDGDRETARALLENMRSPLVEGSYSHAFDFMAFERFREICDWVEHPLPPLLNAARARRLDELDQMLQNGADVNQTAEDGRTALHVAATFGNVSVIDWLARAGADVNARDAKGMTPLMTACFERESDAAYGLLEAKADPNLRDAEGFTALHHASRRQEPRVVAQLLEHGAAANVLNKAGDSPLLLAVCYDYEQQNVLVLLQHNAAPDIRNAKGRTPLHYAAAYGRMVALRLLIEHGADVNAVDDDGIIPLHWAAGNGQLEAVRMLLEQGADVGARDRWQRTVAEDAADARRAEGLRSGSGAVAGSRGRGR